MKKIKNKKLEKTLAVLVELLEFICIVLVAVKVLHTDIKDVLIVLLVFFISRFSIGEQGHYKIVSYFDNGWKRCFFWTSSLILSLALVTKLGLFLSLLFTVFTVYVISGKANINDMMLGYKVRKEDGKYYDIEEYVKYNSVSTDLLDFEENLRRRDNLLYLIYKYRFRDGLSFSQISEKLDNMENARIVEKLDQIALAIRIHCGI